ncbi:MAG TPA: hypothetical protein VK864_19020, partial [Longimicrobiales bacterium]|nr:hypothetical protein [Longimicrobiales bacterium]
RSFPEHTSTHVLDGIKGEAERAFTRDGRVVFVLGTAGSGITTCLQRCARTLAPRRSGISATYVATATAGGSVWGEIVRRLTWRTRALGTAGTITVTWLGVLPVIGRLVQLGQATVKTVRGVRARDKTVSRLAAADAVRQIIEQRAKTPQLICVDNLQTFSAEDVTALGLLLRALPRTRTLLVLGVTARRAQLPAALRNLLLEAERSGTGRAFELPPLTSAQIAAVASHHLQVYVPDVWVDWLAGHSRGNPARLMRVLRELRERRYVERSGRSLRWRATPPVDFVLLDDAPGSADPQVNDSDRELLTYAAITGTTFFGAVVAELLSRPELDVEDAFARLCRAGILQVVPQSVEELEITSRYAFRDAHFAAHLIAECESAQLRALRLRAASAQSSRGLVAGP